MADTRSVHLVECHDQFQDFFIILSYTYQMSHPLEHSTSLSFNCNPESKTTKPYLGFGPWITK
jgi:hypothetical protein